MQDKCLVNGCLRNVRVIKHGLCYTHYCRYRKTGETGKAEICIKKSIESYKDRLKNSQT